MPSILACYLTSAPPTFPFILFQNKQDLAALAARRGQLDPDTFPLMPRTRRTGRDAGTPGRAAPQGSDPTASPIEESEEEETGAEESADTQSAGDDLPALIAAALAPLTERLAALEKQRSTPVPQVDLSPARTEEEGGRAPEGGSEGDPSGPGGTPQEDEKGPSYGDEEEEGGDEEEEFSPYAPANPYERPMAQLQVPSPHLWELSDTPGCGDYKIALRDKDRAVHELKLLHSALSYLHDALEDLADLIGAGEGEHSRRLRRIFRTVDGVFDLAERRRAEVEVIMNARSSLATEEDKAAADYIKNIGRGFAGGVVVRHKGVADEIASFIKEAQNSRLKQLAKLAANKRKVDQPIKETTPPGGGPTKGARPNG